MSLALTVKRNMARAVLKYATTNQITRASLPSGILEFLSRYGKSPDLAPAALVSKYWGWVHACANLSATRFATVPLKLYASRGTGESKVSNFATKAVKSEQTHYLKNKSSVKALPQVSSAEEFEEIEDHPLLDLLQKVNENENGYELKELTSIMLDLTGNSYWYLEKDKMGVPQSIFLLRSQFVRVVPDANQFISGYWYGYHNSVGYDNRLRLEKDEVISFKYPNPFDPWYGMGLVQAAAYSIENQEMREKFIIATMGNMGRPDMVVKYLEGELDLSQRQQVEREWNATMGGPQKAGKVKVTDYRYELEKIGWSPSELDFSAGEDWIMKKIAGVWAVPIGLLDTSQISKAPRAGMEGADLFMSRFNTLPRCTRFEEKLNEQLCPLYDDRLFLAFDNPVPADQQMQLKEDQTYLNTGIITINEVRKREGMDPVEWGDKPLLPTTIAPLGSAPQVSPEAGASNPNKLPKGNNQAISTQESQGGSPGGALAEAKPEVNVMRPPFGKMLDSGEFAAVLKGEQVHPTLAGMDVRLKRVGRGVESPTTRRKGKGRGLYGSSNKTSTNHPDTGKFTHIVGSIDNIGYTNLHNPPLVDIKPNGKISLMNPTSLLESQHQQRIMDDAHRAAMDDLGKAKAAYGDNGHPEKLRAEARLRHVENMQQSANLMGRAFVTEPVEAEECKV